MDEAEADFEIALSDVNKIKTVEVAHPQEVKDDE